LPQASPFSPLKLRGGCKEGLRGVKEGIGSKRKDKNTVSPLQKIYETPVRAGLLRKVCKTRLIATFQDFCGNFFINIDSLSGLSEAILGKNFSRVIEPAPTPRETSQKDEFFEAAALKQFWSFCRVSLTGDTYFETGKQ